MSQGETSYLLVFGKKSWEKYLLGRNVAGRSVSGRNVFQGETSFYPVNSIEKLFQDNFSGKPYKKFRISHRICLQTTSDGSVNSIHFHEIFTIENNFQHFMESHFALVIWREFLLDHFSCNFSNFKQTHTESIGSV